MVVNESGKANRSVRPKLKPIIDGNNVKSVPKTEKKHRLKQRFEVIKKLGQGTYGKVQLAINKETGQEVAVKTIKKSKVENEQDLIRIRREIQIMSSIQHPHIIHIYEVFENKDKIVLVMQYASGGEVYEYVSHKKVLSDIEARRVFRQIATAIYYCHKNKICHRDLKLENILLDEKGNAKIADFGLSNVFDQKHFLQTFCGSPLYASPEIVKGSPYYGPEVDCWSLGVLLYTLVYGAMPFDGSNFKKLVKQISESNYFEPKQKSEASDLIKRLLAPNPTQRATIIDICTDWWVNQGYEHSLLQVAEDMANLTPVRLEILLALAPVSPSADKSVENPFGSSEVKIEETIDKTNENIENLEKLNTDLNETENISKKRLANPSFDKSLSAITTQTPKKKKSQNVGTEGKNIDNRSATESIESIQMTDESNCDEIKSNTVVSNEQNEIKSDFDTNITQTKIEDNSGLDSLTKTDDNVCQSVERLTHPIKVDEKLSDQNEIKEKDKIQIQETINDIENKQNDSLVESTKPKQIREENLEQNKDSERVIEKSTESDASQNEIKEITKKTEELEDMSIEKKKESKHEKKKTKPERRMSTKRPGKLSIPNIWNKSIDLTDTQMDDSRNPSFDSKAERKVPFIPIGFRVSDAKRAFERRCSVPANNLLHSMSTYKQMKDSETVETEEKKKLNSRQRTPKLSSRSMSMNEMLESPKKVQELNDILKNKEEEINKINANKALDVKSDETNNKSISEATPTPTPLEEVTHNELISTPVIDKNMAKDILKKSIAKAKLMEKRHDSNESISSSPVTTPLVSIENSDISILSEPSFFRKARPFVKEESDKPAIESNIKIEVKAKNEKTMKSDSIADNSVANKDISSEVVTGSSEIEDKDKVTSAETKSAPIARSYKKVTFTKDGACVTETGKIYSSEGNEGSYTRVEKKSKVTHFPTVEIQPKTHEDTQRTELQRSDSHSSSGSLDIFDDIFDNHWCGDEVLFPNMKSLLQGVMGNRKSRRRSRAESCERNASDWFGLRKNASNVSDQDIEDDDYESFFSRGLRSTSRNNTSLFDKSVFSRHFQDIDKEFGELDNSYRDLNRSISRDRTSFSSRIHPSSFKIVFGPQTSIRTNKSVVPFETEDDDHESASLVNSSANRWTREPERSSTSNLRKIDSFDSPRKRVEQWLQSDNCDDNNEETEIRSGPLSMYATIGPRGVRRYLRTMSGRSNDKPNIESGNSSASIGLLRNNSSSQQSNVHSVQSSTIPSNSVLEMRFSLNPMTVENNSKIMNTNTSLSDHQTTCETSDLSDEYQSSIALPESSSLLEQLRTHGYRNIVSQRLSGSSLFSDLDSSPSEIDKNYKRGKSVLNCSSDIVNENVNACECMGETNLKVTSSATTSETAVATDINANNNESKASESLNIANRIDFTQNISETLNNCLNQQSSESTSRRSARYPSNISKTTVTDDLPECNPTLKSKLTTNKNVNFKESVQERIHRKSFYSRFNDDRPVLSSRQRRRSFIDSDDIDLAFSLKSSHLSRRSNSFRNSLSLEDNNFMLSKPPPSSSDWFTRMESKASQLMDDLLDNDRVFPIRSRSRLSSENNFSLDSRRRSSSATRSALSTPHSFKSDFDSYFNSISNNLDINGENDSQIDSMDNIKSSEEVLKKAIEILSQPDSK